MLVAKSVPSAHSPSPPQRWPRIFKAVGAFARSRCHRPRPEQIPDQRIRFHFRTAIALLMWLGVFVSHVAAAQTINLDLTAPASTEVSASFDYTVTLTNTGSTDLALDHTVIQDTLPTGVNMMSAFNAGKIFYCQQSGQTVTCTPNPFPGAGFTIPSGASWSFTISVVVATYSGCSPISNVVTLTDSVLQLSLSSPTVSTVLTDCKPLYTVTPIIGPNGSVSPSTPQQVAAGNTITFAASPDAGYDAWIEGCDGGTFADNVFQSRPINQDCAVTTTFYPRNNVITPVGAPHATISPNTSVQVSQVGRAIFTITADPGYLPALAPTTDCSGTDSISGQTLTFQIFNQTKDCTLVAAVVPTITLSSDKNPAIEGEDLTLIATVSDPSYPGEMSFSLFPSPLFPPPTLCMNVPVPANGVVRCHLTADIVSQFTPGPITATFVESGSSNLSYAELSLRFVSASTTVLVSSINPSTSGQGVTFTATVRGSSPTGRVTFTDSGEPVCSNVALSGGSAGCSLSALSVGSHTFVASYDGDANNAASVSTVLLQTVNSDDPVTAVNLNQHGLSGSWGRSDAPGTRQGLLFTFYPDNIAAGHGTVFAGWYTYDVAGGSGGQRWYALQGDVYSNSSSASLGIYTSSDGNLNSGSSPTNSQVGTATLSFSDCSNGTLAYTFDDGRSGSIPLSRVTHSTATCSANGDTGAAAQNYLLSGAWIVTNAVGMGFVIDVSPADNTLLGSWYTYFPAGYTASSPRQQWFVFQDSNFTPTQTSSNNIPVLQASGGTFDATASGGVATTTVGSIDLNFISCTTATLTYTISSESVSATTVNLVRLGPAPSRCAYR